MDLVTREVAHRKRVLIMVSKLDHCLGDLLYRYRRRSPSTISPIGKDRNSYNTARSIRRGVLSAGGTLRVTR
jgi:formyltetrahydrofolate hydrolase